MATKRQVRLARIAAGQIASSHSAVSASNRRTARAAKRTQARNLRNARAQAPTYTSLARSVTRQNRTREAGGAGRSGVAQPSMTRTPRQQARQFRQSQAVVRQQKRQEVRKAARQETRRKERIQRGVGVEARRTQRQQTRRFERQQPQLVRALAQQRGHLSQARQVAIAAKLGPISRDPRYRQSTVEAKAWAAQPQPKKFTPKQTKEIKVKTAPGFKAASFAAPALGLAKWVTQSPTDKGKAPGQHVLDNITRTGNFSSGALASVAKDITKGKRVDAPATAARALSAGVKSATGSGRKERKTADDVFKAVGWKKKSTARTLAAVGVDIATDPLTYTGVGTGSRALTGARRAARAAGIKESKAAAKEYGPKVAAGRMTNREAQDRATDRAMRAGESAMRATLKSATPAQKRTGVTLKFGARDRGPLKHGKIRRDLWRERRAAGKRRAATYEYERKRKVNIEDSMLSPRGGPVAPRGPGKRSPKPKDSDQRKQEALARARKANDDRKAKRDATEAKSGRIPLKSTLILSATSELGSLPRRLTGGRGMGDVTRGRVRSGAAEITSQVRPRATSKRAFDDEKAIRREFRAEEQRLQRRTLSRLNAVKQFIGDDEWDTLIDAVEAGDTRRLRGTSSRPKIQGRGDGAITRARTKGYRVVARRLRELASELRRGTGGHLRDNRARAKRGLPPRPTTRQSLNDANRLEKAANQIVADLKFIERRAARSGVSASRIGPRATRSLEDVELAIKAGKKPRDIRRRLREAEEDLKTAPLERRTDARRRVQALRAEARTSRRTRYEAGKARKTQAGRAEERRRTEAQGYFPRVDKADIEDADQSRGARLKRDRERLGDQPEIERVFSSEGGAKKPKPAPAEQRAHRKSRAQLREGTGEEKELVKRWSSDVPQTLGRYYRSMSRGVARAEQNRKAMEAFGKRTGGGQQAVNLAALRAQVSRERVVMDRLNARAKQLEASKADNPTKRKWLREVKERQAEQSKVVDELDARLKQGRYKAAQPLRNMSPQQSIYELRRGGIEEIKSKPGFGEDPTRGTATKRAMEGERGKGTKASGQYYVATRPQIERVLDSIADPQHKLAVGRFFDRWQGRMKGFLLMTPGYLFRNATGDLTNAWSDEAFWRVMRETFRGTKDLNALGRYERAQKRFDSYVPKSEKKTKITEVQRAAIRAHTGADPGKEITTLQLGLLAEEFGAIRQGRFEEMFEEGAKPGQASPWQNVVKRVEDMARIATFRGALDRGQNPRQAAARVAKLHFDYGDLSKTERSALRRIAPFYTFTSRNVPLWTKTALARPGKLNKLAYAQQEAERQHNLPENYRNYLNPFEKRQMGIPIRIGTNKDGSPKFFMASIGSPFVDVNTPASLIQGPAQAGVELANRAFELAGPFVGPVGVKPIIELLRNHNFFYRESIESENTQRGIRTEIPGAVRMALKAADPKTRKLMMKNAGITEETNPNEEGGPLRLVWRRKTDHAFNNLLGLGPLGVLNRSVLAPEESSRGMDKDAQRASALGLRTSELKSEQLEMTRLFEEVEKLERRQTQLRKMPNKSEPMVRLKNGNKRYQRISAKHPTKEYTRNKERLNAAKSRAFELYESDKAYAKGEVRGTPKAAAPAGVGLEGVNLSGLKGPKTDELKDLDLSGLK